MSRSSIGSTGSESLLDVLIRVNANHKAIQETENVAKRKLDSILDKFGLYVIDYAANKAPEFNCYIYRICIEACKESEDNPRQLQALTQSKSKHQVIIFDGLNCFNYRQFKARIHDDSVMENISVVCEPDSFNLLVTIYRYFTEQAALNIHLKLVIIYCDDLFIRDLMEFLIRRKLSFFVVLISYNISMNYIKGFFNGEVQGIEFLSINTLDENICVKKMCKGKVKAVGSFKSPSIRSKTKS